MPATAVTAATEAPAAFRPAAFAAPVFRTGMGAGPSVALSVAEAASMTASMFVAGAAIAPVPGPSMSAVPSEEFSHHSCFRRFHVSKDIS
jgi:hypothetical protein